MTDIEKILICPECKADLDSKLQCTKCGAQYSRKHGVYDLISMKLSGNQEYLYTDEIPDDIYPLYRDIYPEGFVESNDDYNSRLNEETKEAQKKQDEYVRELLKGMTGCVCDLATGGGCMLQKILDSAKNDVSIVCTDINMLELIMTRLRRNGDRTNISYIGTDGRYLSVKDDSFDYITSLAGFGNIPDSDMVAHELYRVLKPGGKIIIEGSYIEKGTKSYDLACGVGIERGLVEEFLIHDLKKAGFDSVKSTVLGEAIWAENPYDLIPAAGDNQRFCVIEAVKPN